MESRFLSMAIGLFLVLSTACYSTYTGIYFIDEARRLSRDEAESLARGVADTLAPLGFVETHHDPTGRMVTWANGRGSISPELASLNGVNATITIAVSLDEPSLTIRDLSHVEETDFMRALKLRVEEQIAESGAIHVEFRRQLDLF